MRKKGHPGLKFSPMAPGPAMDVTQLLQAWAEGDREALGRLVPAVHTELRRIARRQMGHERADHTLQPTALVNEAYLRLVNINRIQWQDRAHFFALAARVMRRVLVDAARARGYKKRGAGAHRVSLDESRIGGAERGPDLLALDDALTALALVDERKCHVVELRFFGGLSTEEIAHTLQVSDRTVKRDWTLAKLWLLREMRRSRS